MCDAIAGIPFHIEEVMTKLVLENVKAQHKGVDSCFSATLESLIERIVKKVVNSPEAIGQIVQAVSDNPGFVAPVATFVKSEQSSIQKRERKSKSAFDHLSRLE